MNAMGGRAKPERRAVALRYLRALVAALHQSARAVERRTGVTNAQLFILRELIRTEGLSINELAARALTGQNTISTIVTRLEHGGLIRRERASEDGRRVVVTLTPAGRRVVRRAPEPPTAQVLAALARMGAKDVDQLGRSLQALTDAMGAAVSDTGMLFERNGGPAGPASAGSPSSRTVRTRRRPEVAPVARPRRRPPGGSP